MKQFGKILFHRIFRKIIYFFKGIQVTTLIILFLLVFCGPEAIKKYRIPKDFLAPVEQSQLISQWSPPGGWREKTPTSMRIRSFSIPNEDGELVGDFGLIVMPLAGNRLVDNINLWRNELKLNPIKLGEENNYYTKIQINGYPVYLVDMVSQELLVKNLYPERTLVVFFSHKDRQYFFKLKGPPSLIDKEKKLLLDTLEEIRFE